MATLLVVIHIITCIFLILFVLLQAGKGAEVGATFGGISQTYFGTQGGNVLTKITTTLAFVFMLTSIGLTALHHRKTMETVMQDEKPAVTTETAAPAADAVAPENAQTEGTENKK
ncbi:MAG: preprotein translocase subunit SecG [Oligoflexia bacterium]|nr:preprotein translocase subunit SecG [Oligoflexia bacterium]